MSHPINSKEITQVEPVKTYKYICMKRINGETFSNRPVYRIFNIKHGSQLGMIAWYNPWQQYIFTSREGCVFNKTCLQDVIEFLEFEIPLLIHRDQSIKQEKKSCTTKSGTKGQDLAQSRKQAADPSTLGDGCRRTSRTK